jgi:hypothetical protein
MGILKWIEETPGQCPIRAELVNININLIDLCEGRFWGGHEFQFKLIFAIYERIETLSQWTHQLLMPNSVHIYCRNVEEAKELAETSAIRIFKAFKEQLPVIKVKRNNIKDKKFKLEQVMESRGIFGRVWYSRIQNMAGWWLYREELEPQFIGLKYEQALDFIKVLE